jgi:photosystem II stability/assembly factor-like uncharacterized protein
VSVSTTYYLAVGVTVDTNNPASIALTSKTGGSSWTSSGSIAAKLTAVTIGSNGNAYAIGTSTVWPIVATVFRSTATSTYATWTSTTIKIGASNLAVTFNAINSFDGVNVVAVGNAGYIIVSANSGTTWTQPSLPSGTTVNFYGIASVSASVIMVAGQSGIVLRSTNGGSTWTSLASQLLSFSSTLSTVNFQYRTISMLSASTVYVGGSNGLILKSQDGGLTWSNDADSGSTSTGTQVLGSSIYTLSFYGDALHGIVGPSHGGNGYTRVNGECVRMFVPHHLSSIHTMSLAYNALLLIFVDYNDL